MKSFNALNDYFVRYLFTSSGSEAILLDFINSVMKDSNFNTFKSLEILTPFNIKNNYLDKESIVDVKCVTEKNSVVIIEVQLQGNLRFSNRILYYWAKTYSNILKHGESYDSLHPVISINLLNFNISDDDKVHSCYILKDKNSNRIFSDHLQIHLIELKKFRKDLLSLDLNIWLDFFTNKNLEESMSDIVKEKTIMDEVREKYIQFIADSVMMSEYEKRQIYLADQRLHLEEQKELSKEEGMRKGIQKGILEKQIDVAKRLKSKNMDINFISEITGLSAEEIEKL